MRGMEMAVKAMKGVLFIGALLGASSSALAAAGLTYTNVEALAGSATIPMTYSRDTADPKKALTSYLAYKFTVVNISGNTINNIVVQGTATVKEPTEALSLSSVEGASCSQSPLGLGNPLTITCPVGQLKAGSSVQFTVFLKAPEKAAIPTVTNDYVGLQGRTITAEGANSGKSPNDSVDFWPVDDPRTVATVETFDTCDGAPLDSSLTGLTHSCVRVKLGTPDAARLKSAVPKAGGTFFTGVGGVPGYLVGDETKPDPFATSIEVPASGIVATADIVEGDPVTTNYTCTFKTIVEGVEVPACGAIDLTIIDTSKTGEDNHADYSPGYLKIVIRVDSSVIARTTNLKFVKLLYNGTEISRCPNETTPIGGGVPCEAKRFQYPKNPKSPLDPALSNDYEFWILNNKNGRLEFF